MMSFRLALVFMISAVAAAALDDIMSSMQGAWRKVAGDHEICRLALRVLAFEDEIASGEKAFPDAGLSTFRYNLYDPTTTTAASSDPSASQPTPIGIYIGASHSVNQNDCIGTGSFNFDYNTETDSYDSQIYVSVSCSGSFNAIIGGTGRYAFIKNGHEVILDARDVPGASISELQFTSETCGTEHKGGMVQRV
jgi:hypothetical protein